MKKLTNPGFQYKWSKFVNYVTVFWLLIFILGLFSKGVLEEVCHYSNLMILLIFLFDLVIVYLNSNNLKDFIFGNWFDILMVIPYFRIFRVAKFARLLKLLKVSKLQPLVKRLLALNKIKKFVNLSVFTHELLDLYRTIKSRFIKA